MTSTLEGYTMLLHPFGGYVEAFDRGKTYAFMREGWDSPSLFKLEDASPYMNVYGLYFKEPFSVDTSSER